MECIGCRAIVPETDGLVHEYLGVSPGCWAVYGEVLAKECGDYRCARVHQLTVDAYSVQHPGEPERRTIQSVAVHLISLHLQLDEEIDGFMATNAIKRAVRHKKQFVWLEPPPSLGSMTILDVAVAQDPKAHANLVRQWAQSLWQAWSPHQATIRGGSGLL